MNDAPKHATQSLDPAARSRRRAGLGRVHRDLWSRWCTNSRGDGGFRTPTPKTWFRMFFAPSPGHRALRPRSSPGLVPGLAVADRRQPDHQPVGRANGGTRAARGDTDMQRLLEEQPDLSGGRVGPVRGRVPAAAAGMGGRASSRRRSPRPVWQAFWRTGVEGQAGQGSRGVAGDVGRDGLSVQEPGGCPDPPRDRAIRRRVENHLLKRSRNHGRATVPLRRITV